MGENAARSIRDKVCVVGVGESEYGRHGSIARPEFQLAIEAILAACSDAGLDPRRLNGFASYANDRNDAIRIATALGVEQTAFNNMHWGGGGGGVAGAVANAAAAIVAGYADYVVAYRALAQGQFRRFGQASVTGRSRGQDMWRLAAGLLTPPQRFALPIRRYMYEYGVTSEHLGLIAVASYKHAQHNPRAIMKGRPITIEDHQNSRMIADPLRLYDCCQETDGAAAVILTTPERARDLRRPLVYLAGAAQGAGYREGAMSDNRPNYTTAAFSDVARRLYASAGMGPEEIDVAQIYENFTGLVLMAMEDFGLCGRGEAGRWVEGGRIEHQAVADAGAPHAGALPINTSGGNLAEAYTHGFELMVEATRQLNGTATLSVEDARTSLLVSGPGVAPASALILHN